MSHTKKYNTASKNVLPSIFIESYHRPSKTARLKVLLSTFVAIATLGILSLKASNQKSKAEPREPQPAPLHSESISNQQEVVQTDTSSKETFNQLVNLLRRVPNNTRNSTKISQQATLLQVLSERPDGTCTAFSLSPAVLQSFIQMVREIPTDQLNLAIQNNPQNTPFYSFRALAHVLQNDPKNSDAMRQQMFLQQARYQTHKRFSEKVPSFEKDKDFLYLDAATKIVNGEKVPDDHPTVGKGINLHAYPELLRYLRFQNSPLLQEIIHPNDIQNRSNEPYVYLSLDQLNLWVKSALEKGFHNYVPEHFLKVYNLRVHPADMAALDAHFQKAVSRAIKTAESELEKRTTQTLSPNESVMYGTFSKPVPIRMACVAADFAYSSKYPLRHKKGWPSFCNYYELRDFWHASQETYSRQTGLRRNLWRRYNMISDKHRAVGGVLLGGMAGAACAAMVRRRRRKKSRY